MWHTARSLVFIDAKILCETRVSSTRHPKYLRGLLFRGSGLVIRALVIRPLVLKKVSRHHPLTLNVSHLD